MKPAEYYTSLMAVIDFVAEGHSVITLEDGRRLSGRYWPRIYCLFRDEKIGVPITGGEFHITQAFLLDPIYEDCIHAIEELGKLDEDRALDNKTKKANTKFAKWAIWISVIALIVSFASFAWQVIESKSEMTETQTELPPAKLYRL